MTGYIWLCEPCNGTGAMIFVPSGVDVHMDKDWVFGMATDMEMIKILTCQTCNGVGYWEPI